MLFKFHCHICLNKFLDNLLLFGLNISFNQINDDGDNYLEALSYPLEEFNLKCTVLNN